MAYKNLIVILVSLGIHPSVGSSTNCIPESFLFTLFKGTTGSGVFTFNDSGEFQKFTAMRYMGSGPDAKKYEWYVSALETKEMSGIKIPVRCNATWRLETGDWTWAQFEVKSYALEP